jgi:hypothetical protein
MTAYAQTVNPTRNPVPPPAADRADKPKWENVKMFTAVFGAGNKAQTLAVMVNKQTNHVPDRSVTIHALPRFTIEVGVLRRERPENAGAVGPETYLRFIRPGVDLHRGESGEDEPSVHVMHHMADVYADLMHKALEWIDDESSAALERVQAHFKAEKERGDEKEKAKRARHAANREKKREENRARSAGRPSK